MWNFIKGLFKFVFSLLAITTVVVGIGELPLLIFLKKTLKISKEKRKKSFLISKTTINLYYLGISLYIIEMCRLIFIS